MRTNRRLTTDRASERCLRYCVLAYGTRLHDNKYIPRVEAYPHMLPYPADVNRGAGCGAETANKTCTEARTDIFAGRVEKSVR